MCLWGYSNIRPGQSCNSVFDSVFLSVVYDGKGTLEEGETAEARFIKIQAAYELLMDSEKKRQYDMDNRVNPMKVCIYKNHKLWNFIFPYGIFKDEMLCLCRLLKLGWIG